MIEKLDDNELEKISFMHDPVALMETLIPSNLKAPHTWGTDDQGITVRPYQMAMLDYSYMYADDPELKEKENFKKKIGAGTCYNISARNTGKSYCDQCNDFFTLIHGEGDESCHSSFDFKHLKKVLTPVANLAKFHPFFEMFRRSGKDGSVRWTGGGLEVDTMLGHTLYGKNEKADSDDPGTDFHGLHTKRWTSEEHSYATTKGMEKRVDAISSLGCIDRFSGIPDVRKGSPLGDLLLDDTRKNRICRLPQYVREDWDEDTKQRAIKEYNGESSFAYKLNVLAETIEGAFGRWDMRRVRKLCYNPKKKIKEFEFGRDNIAHLDSCPTFEEKTEKIYELLNKTIVIDNVPSELTIIASDIGTTGTPSQVCIFFGNKDKMKWRYLISLFRLTTQEQARIFKWLYDKLDKVVISLDCTDADGRAIADELEILGIPKDRITRNIMHAKIKVGFSYDKEGNVEIEKNGEPIYKIESTIDWACSELDKIFYNSLIEIPHSELFLKEFPAYFATKIGTRFKYGSSTSDHLVQSFQCFSICRFYNLNTDLLEQKPQDTYIGGF
ncbi:MAG: hypothetical protein R6U15_08305 [Candidatus Izemoplasmatales bacterium]